jgi:hypothetical protein
MAFQRFLQQIFGERLHFRKFHYEKMTLFLSLPGGFEALVGF